MGRRKHKHTKTRLTNTTADCKGQFVIKKHLMESLALCGEYLNYINR